MSRFVGWADGFDSTTVDAYANRLDEARAVATPEAMAAAVQVATRYAAVDTGAIEGLYSTNRGFTRTIAEQTATWQEAYVSTGPMWSVRSMTPSMATRWSLISQRGGARRARPSGR